MGRRVAFVLLAIVALATTSCGDDLPDTGGATGDLTETTLTECVIDQGTTAPAEPRGGELTTLEEGKLIVGSDTTFPPFESIENGKAVGFDIDLITEIADRVGDLQVEVQSSAFDTIFTSLAAKKYDVVISSVTIKEDRKQTVDFTDPYFSSDQSLSVRAADADSIGGVEDLEGKTVGVQATTTGEDCAKNALQAKGKAAEVRSYDGIPDAFTDLAARRVDAVLVDLPTAQQIVEDRSGIEVVQVIRTEEELGIAVSKENPDLRVAINAALSDIRDDGTFRRLFVKWFKTEPPA
jgi:ABC-type amino acid transport substrate-binding protein